MLISCLLRLCVCQLCCCILPLPRPTVSRAGTPICDSHLHLTSLLQSSSSLGGGIYFGVLDFAQPVQMFVVGPRLVLSVREYHAKLIAKSDEGTSMTTIAFQGRGHPSTSDGA
jgi:hypothetical protein